VSAQSPIASVLEQVAFRSEEGFYDDVLLVDEQGSFLGMIFTRTLVQLQHRLLRENIERLEDKQREINAKNEQMHEELRMARGTACDVASTIPNFSGGRSRRSQRAALLSPLLPGKRG
jgi:hypothetical protein